MILVDFNQIMLATISIQMKNAELDENLVRHIALSSLKSIRTRFMDKYGDLVICCDHGYSWRRDVYSFYKHCRRESRKSSTKDWHSIFSVLNKIRDEIQETFHYPVIHVEKCEADDIIGVLCQEFGDTNEPILIYSGDKDFGQLQKFKNVDQYSPSKKDFIKIEDPNKYLKEHIIRGDGGDGIPNFLSPDDTFAAGASQKKIYTSKVTQWLEMDPNDFTDENTHYKRNQLLIDLSMTPSYLWTNIMDAYKKEQNKQDNDVIGYFTKNRLKLLMNNIQEFTYDPRSSRNTERSLF